MQSNSALLTDAFHSALRAARQNANVRAQMNSWIEHSGLSTGSYCRCQKEKGTSMRTLVTVTIALVLFGCSGAKSRRDVSVEGQLTLAQLAASNQARLVQLSVGMSRKEVILLMGNQTAKTHDGVVNNPWTSETSLGKDGAQYEALYYIIRPNQPFTPVRKSLATAIVLKNGSVVSWGENAFDRYQ